MVKALLTSKLARLGCTAGAAASCTLARPTTASSTRSHILAWTRYRRIHPLSSVVTHGHHHACGEPTLAGAEWPADTARSGPTSWPQDAQPLPSLMGERTPCSGERRHCSRWPHAHRGPGAVGK